VKSQVPVLVKTGEILREQLKKIGITLEVQPLESGQYFEAMVGKKFDIVAGWWSVTVDPDMFYSPLQHSSSPWNFAGFKSEEADKRIEAFRFTSARPRARRCTRSWCAGSRRKARSSSSATRSRSTG
jgi:ABC-type transport system substrate-binding protein